MHRCRDLWSVVPPPEEEEDYSDDEEGDDLRDRQYEPGSGAVSAELSSTIGAGLATSFVSIVSEMVSTGHAEGHPADSLLMEIKGCKFAQNKVFASAFRPYV